MNKPIIVERYADNGSFSHYALIQEETGELLWSEEPEEEIQKVKNCSIPVFTKRNWFEKLPLHWRFLYYFIGGIIIGLLLPYFW